MPFCIKITIFLPKSGNPSFKEYVQQIRTLKQQMRKQVVHSHE